MSLASDAICHCLAVFHLYPRDLKVIFIKFKKINNPSVRQTNTYMLFSRATPLSSVLPTVLDHSLPGSSITAQQSSFWRVSMLHLWAWISFKKKKRMQERNTTAQSLLSKMVEREVMCSDSLSCKQVANHQHICQQGKSRSLLRPGRMQQFSFQWHDPFNWINTFRPSLSAVLLKAIDMKSGNKLLPEKYVTLFFFLIYLLQKERRSSI